MQRERRGRRSMGSDVMAMEDDDDDDDDDDSGGGGVHDDAALRSIESADSHSSTTNGSAVLVSSNASTPCRDSRYWARATGSFNAR